MFVGSDEVTAHHSLTRSAILDTLSNQNLSGSALNASIFGGFSV